MTTVAPDRVRIVEGLFALVSAGNCTQTWIADGDDVQDRANAVLGAYWSNDGKLASTIHERGVQGWGVHIEGDEEMLRVFASRQAADREYRRIVANLISQA